MKESRLENVWLLPVLFFKLTTISKYVSPAFSWLRGSSVDVVTLFTVICHPPNVTTSPTLCAVADACVGDVEDVELDELLDEEVPVFVLPDPCEALAMTAIMIMTITINKLNAFNT